MDCRGDTRLTQLKLDGYNLGYNLVKRWIAFTDYRNVRFAPKTND